jgi:prephenate dehydratase
MSLKSEQILEQLEKDPLMLNHVSLRNSFLGWLQERTSAVFLTLGPEETSSYVASRYLTEYVRQSGIVTGTSIRTFDHFAQVYDRFKQGYGDLIVVPNAYEDITKMYWDEGLEIIFSFYYPTPLYGLAVRDEAYRSKPRLTIASCPAVFSLIDKLGGHLIMDQAWDIRTVASTTMAAEAVHEGRADVAVTNETSLQRFQLRFIAKGYGVNMLWTVFKRKGA